MISLPFWSESALTCTLSRKMPGEKKAQMGLIEKNRLPVSYRICIVTRGFKRKIPRKNRKFPNFQNFTRGEGVHPHFGKGQKYF